MCLWQCSQEGSSEVWKPTRMWVALSHGLSFRAKRKWKTALISLWFLTVGDSETSSLTCLSWHPHHGRLCPQTVSKTNSSLSYVFQLFCHSTKKNCQEHIGENPFTQRVWETWIFPCRRIKVDLSLSFCTKIIQN